METNPGPNSSFYVPKWLVVSLGVLIMLLVLLLIIQQGHDLQLAFMNSKPVNTLQMSGEGKITATPDLATVTIGVVGQGSTATAVQNQTTQKVNQVIAYIKSQGVADKDISTSEFSLEPQQNYPNIPVAGAPTIVGYSGNQTVTVMVHGVDKDQSVLDKIIDGAVTNGANQIQGVDLSFENSTLSTLQQQAQQAAINDAKQKAQVLAQQAGLTLGKVVNVSENSSPVMPLPFAVNSAMGMGGSAAQSATPNVQVGSQEIDETMTLTFEIK